MGGSEKRGGRADHGAGPVVRIGVTGHIKLSAETIRLVAAELYSHLTDVQNGAGESSRVMVGVSCLAPGADSVFAEVLLSLGGRLEAIVPCVDYARSQLGPDDAATFEDLLRRADSVRTATVACSAHAYVAANNEMLDTIDHLVAVWDGDPQVAPGGTAHVVETAVSRAIPVTVIWPEGACRG